MSTCIEKLECKDCGSSDSLQTYLNVDEALGIEWYTSFCHGQCWETKGDPYAKTKAPEVYVKTREDIERDVSLIRSCKIFKPKKSYRGIPAKFFRQWGCRLLYTFADP